MERNFLTYILLCILFFTSSSCRDDLPLYGGGEVGEGESVISATVKFKSFTPALNGSTRTAGDAIKAINSLCVLLYDEDGNLVRKYPLKPGGASGEGTYKLSDDKSRENNEKTDSNGNTFLSAEKNTPHADFQLTVPYGRYYIYAVANMGDLSNKPVDEDLKEAIGDVSVEDSIKTIRGLRNIPLRWNEGNIGANNQMIGHFVSLSDTGRDGDGTSSGAEGTDAGSTSADDGAPLLTINRANMKLRAWLRRAASKVTIAYDGSGLADDVSIYIMAASIKDIPRVCPLGVSNTPVDTDLLIHDGEVIKYFGEGDSPDVDGFFDNYKAVVSNQESKQTYGSDHSEKANALFFYENMQGIGEDKRQKDEDNDGKPDNADRLKDDKPCGTYIEVKAVYRSTNTARPGNGIVTYRFMLGKNIIDNYDAERNHHYKLTLHFKNFANDYDWHIDYKEQVLEVTEPKVMNYQGKVFVPDYSLPNRGHEFSDKNTVTVTSYMEEDEKINMNFSIKYRDAGKQAFSDASDWLEHVIEDGDVPYEKKVGFKVKDSMLKPDKEIDINAQLKSAASKGSIGTPYNLADPNGTSNSIVCTANCYMIDAPGWYIFPLVYGNAIHNGADNVKSYRYAGTPGNNTLSVFRNHLDQPITSPYIEKNSGCKPQYAYVVWQDVEAMLRPAFTWDWDPDEMAKAPTYIADAYDVSINGVSTKIGGIRFYVEPENIKQGNAVIAVSDKKPTVTDGANNKFELSPAIWSWHIWVTRLDVEKDDKTIKVTAHDTNRKFDFMPMNLGWCSKKGELIKYYKERECEIQFTSGDKTQTIKIVKKSHIAFTRGDNPYYQWGRKDPFIAANGNTYDNKLRWTYLGWEDKNNPPLLTDYKIEERPTTREALGRLIQHPDIWHNPPRLWTQVDAITNKWQYVSRNETYSNLWEGRPGTDSNAEILKTVYDPCPVGYQVSHYNAFTGFTTTGDNTSYPPERYDVLVQNIAEYDEVTGECGEGGIYSKGLYEFYTNPNKYQSIIFPQSGYRDWDDRVNTYHFDEIGYVWSAGNVKNDDNNSYNFEFSREGDSENRYIRPKNTFFPCDGFPIRPVRNGEHGMNTP